jgi:hypothetical protein
MGMVLSLRFDSKGLLRVVYCHARNVSGVGVAMMGDFGIQSGDVRRDCVLFLCGCLVAGLGVLQSGQLLYIYQIPKTLVYQAVYI